MPAAKSQASAANSAPPVAGRPPQKGDHVFLVDGSGYIFRAYHALPPLSRKSDGLQLNAVYGFCNMLWKLLRDMKPEERPTHLAIVFDKSEKTFRTDMYPAYKAHRPDPPDDLIPQFPLMRKAVDAFGLSCLEQGGFEADDLIATYARQACEAGANTTIVSSDKDLMQLVNDCVVMYDTMKDKRIGRDEVIEKFGVPPDKVTEVQALIGNSTDNVPGVPGIGVKTAAQLIGEYGDLETLLMRAGEIKQEKRRQTLIDNAEKARVSKKLVTLDDHVKLDVPIADLVVHEPDYPRLIAFLKAMEFSSLLRRVVEFSGVDANEVEADAGLTGHRGGGIPSPPPLRGRSAGEAGRESPAQGELLPLPPSPSVKGGGSAPSRRPAQTEADPVFAAVSLAEERAERLRKMPFDRAHYETVRTPERLKAWVARATDLGTVAINVEANSIDPMQTGLCGISLALSPNEACYVPLAHRNSGDGGSGGLFEGGLARDQIEERAALDILRPLWRVPGVLKVGHNVKFAWQVLSLRGIETNSYDDVMLQSYVLDAGRSNHGLDALASRYFGHVTIEHNALVGSGKARVSFDCVDIGKAAEYAAEHADLILRLWLSLKPRLAIDHVTSVYESLERPLAAVLARMERRGISIDRQVLSRLSGEFAQRAAGLEAEVRELADEPAFNPGSPKQLGDILFGKFGLPGGTKTKTGQWATGARVLDELAEQGHQLPQKILEWRQVTKLKSTYTDALPDYVNPTTHRVHTNYALAATPTGRLSSSEPNLQNIPVRTEEGRKIRRAFIAADGNKLVSADYSQIELRLLAEIANIPALRNAFSEGLDIHAMTASEMFGVPIKGMPGEIRRRAKAINFGIIYGISAFGLANQLGIPREEAGAYIKKYFERFPGIRDFMEETKAFCKKRLCAHAVRAHVPLPGHCRIQRLGPRLQRAPSINARLQGTAADIIRRAMARMDAALAKQKLNAQMLLQVHDELVFEVPEDEVENTMPVIKKVMEEAPLPALSLAVPLQVDARAAHNWDEAH